MKKTKKKVTKPTSISLLVCDGRIQQSFDTYNDARGNANLACDNGALEVKVLEVMRAWEFYYPEEPPDPLVRDVDLDELP